MFAVFRTGGKQFRAEPGRTLQIPSLDVEAGQLVVFDDVLLAGSGEEVAVGEPTLEGAKVTAEVLAHDRTKKITVFKRKRRKGYRRKQGHRQDFTVVRVADITV
ncbi:MAG: 50S ribosomal protein L21 [Gemmatimonadota bacterium]|nr:50S ribosomal protein L21 [Gemmatimonadota bacterium]MDE2984166.1 50S ribosomal protein L21 [Gemmatimonadota bacterium]